MKHVALVTYCGCLQLTDDDRSLIPILRDAEIEAQAVAWDDPSTDWNGFDQVVLRSCWDYHLRASEFLAWIDRMEDCDVAMQNSPRLVRWNADKRYLRQLEACGIVIPQTCWLEERQEIGLHDLLSKQRWRDGAVVKPYISATAYQTRRLSRLHEDEVLQGPAMVQEFMPEVQTFGEWSLVFLGGDFSHAVRKCPADGDFRVQTQFGGTVRGAVASSRLIEKAATVVEALDEPTLYARVDGLERDGEFVLMELELIEPVLFLGIGGAANSLAHKIVASIEEPRVREASQRSTER